MVADMSMVANMSVVLCVLVQLLTCLSRNGLVSAESCINERELKLNILSSDYQCTGCILGTIEICENGKLRKFCDGDWTMEDATVACKTLGYSTEGVQNGFNPSAKIPNPSSTGAVCSGDEASFSDCVTGDAFVDNMNCGARLTLGCGPPVSTATTSPPHAASTGQEPAVIMPQDTTAAKPLETTSSNSATASASAVAGSTTAAIGSQDPQVDSRGFFDGPGLYIFIGGVGAVVVAILVLVQILLTFWCCYRHKAAVTPYSTKECEEGTDMKEDLNDLDKRGVANPILSKSSDLEAPKFQLEQSPPKSSPATSHPTYESIPNGQPQYSSLDMKDAYAQLDPWINKPAAVPYEVVADQNLQYQPLDRTVSVSRQKQPNRPRFGVVNRVALGMPAEDYDEPDSSLETFTREDVLREEPPALPRKGSLPSPAVKKNEMPHTGASLLAESENIYETINNSSSSPAAEKSAVAAELPNSRRKVSTQASQEESFYHIIEPEAPEYSVLEKPGDVEITEAKSKANSLGSASRSSKSSLPAGKKMEQRTASKPSLSKTPSVHSNSSESPSSSSSTSTPNHSPQVSRSIGTRSPLLSNGSNMPRVTNKYTESPVGSRKGLTIMQDACSKRPQHIEPSDRNEMNTLV